MCQRGFSTRGSNTLTSRILSRDRKSRLFRLLSPIRLISLPTGVRRRHERSVHPTGNTRPVSGVWTYRARRPTDNKDRVRPHLGEEGVTVRHTVASRILVERGHDGLGTVRRRPVLETETLRGPGVTSTSGRNTTGSEPGTEILT